MPSPSTCTAFLGLQKIAAGSALHVALAIKALPEASTTTQAALIFDDATGRQIDFDLRGSVEDDTRRLSEDAASVASSAPKGPGRPKLGVVAREVTLLPRHWDWLRTQPGGASVALRKLVEVARGDTAGVDAKRRAQAAADRFMMAMAGDLPQFEDATRALYAGDSRLFGELTANWPADVRRHALTLAAPALGITL